MFLIIDQAMAKLGGHGAVVSYCNVIVQALSFDFRGRDYIIGKREDRHNSAMIAVGNFKLAAPRYCNNRSQCSLIRFALFK